MANEINNVPQINLLKSEIEAAAARVAEKAMNTTFDGVAGVVGDIFGGLVGDGMKQWRARRLVDALCKTKEHLEAKGIRLEHARSIPMGQLLEIFEGASRQDDPDLTRMWSALLSNSMNPEEKESLDPSFVRIMSSLSGLDAQLITYFKQYDENYSKFFSIHRSMSAAMNDELKDKDANRNILKQIEENEDKFNEENARILEVITDHFSESNVSYAIANLIRMDLIVMPRSKRQKLLDVYESSDGSICVDESVLLGELSTIFIHVNAGSETTGRLLPLNWSDREESGSQLSLFELYSGVPFTYRLSGLGWRFLKACS